VSSVTLLGSYLGKPDYVRHLRDERLDPPEVIEDQNLWPWLLSLPVEQREKIFMGYGRQDRFAVLNEELARRLDPEQSVVVEGKHRWTVWSEIWPELLPRVAQAARLREAVLADARAQTDAG
jgi:hypothetical protein